MIPPAACRPVHSAAARPTHFAPEMSDDGDITPEDFERLLRWLDQEYTRAGAVYDRERAGAKYEQIRRRLVVIFASRGCREAEDCADETIRRVTRNVSRIDENWDGNEPVSYFLVVLNFVLREYWRRKPPPQLPPSPPPDNTEAADECLEACLRASPASVRKFVLRYYQGSGREKIDQRKGLAEELGIGVKALRIRMFRIRSKLEECVHKCLAEKEAQ